MRISTIINTSLDRVWEVTSTAGNLENTHPFCQQPRVSSGVGAHDEAALPGGWVYHRHFTHWTDRTGYELDIGAIGEETSVSWHLHPLDDEHTCLTIEVWPRPVSRIPASLIPPHHHRRPTHAQIPEPSPPESTGSSPLVSP